MKTEARKFLGILAFSLSVVISLLVLFTRGDMTSQTLLLVYIPVSYSSLHPFQVQLQLGLGFPDSISTQPSSMSSYFFFIFFHFPHFSPNLNLPKHFVSKTSREQVSLLQAENNEENTVF